MRAFSARQNFMKNQPTTSAASFSLTSNDWDAFITQHPCAHLLQTSAWGVLKSTFGWQPAWVIVQEGELKVGAQILFRRVLPGFSMAYMPRGPVMNETGLGQQGLGLDDPALKSFWQHADQLCRQQRAVFLKVEPDSWQECLAMGEEQPQAESASPTSAVPAGFSLSPHSIQPPRTIVVDLQGSEEQILGRMKQKTRYNIRLAQRKGVVVQPTSDLDAFYRLMAVTGERDGFGVHSQEYFTQAYNLFHPQGEAEILTAEFEGTPLAALMVFQRGGRSWYLYGASSNEQRELMATYLLQWEAMRWARARGCQEYDLWGVPDASLADLEAKFAAPGQASTGLWGVYRFKRGFGGSLCRSAGPYDRVYNRLAYAAYLWRARRSQEG